MKNQAKKSFLKDHVSFLKFGSLYPNEDNDATLEITSFDNIIENASNRLTYLYSRQLKDDIMEKINDLMSFHDFEYLKEFPIIIFSKNGTECFRIKQLSNANTDTSLCLSIEIDKPKDDWHDFFKSLVRAPRQTQTKISFFEIVFVLFLVILCCVAFLK